MFMPLQGVRVLDLTDGLGSACTRMLADLGADVILVEPPGGVRARTAPPMVDGLSLQFAVLSANKRALTIDWAGPAGRDELLALAATADILVESLQPGRLAAAGLGVDVLHAANPRLVITSITDFGQDGPYRDWVATDWVHLALASVLSRSGSPGRPPLMPPGRLASEHAAAQALWVTLVGYWQALQTGAGEFIDVSALEATAQSMDAAFGIGGTATGGVPAGDLPPGRPDASYLYPIFPCLDGRIRICLLAKRQWRAMFEWLGEPPNFADPRFDLVAKRYAARDALYPLIAALCADATHSDLVAEGQRRGIPIESVNDASGVLADQHFLDRGAWADLSLASGRIGQVPVGVLEVDGTHLGVRAPLSEGEGRPDWSPRSSRDVDVVPVSAPLRGLRVLDLGVIVVGAETGRLFADLGADVLKIESSAFPDGSRASSRSGTLSASFAWGHRNKRSLGLDLRTERGRELFLRLVAMSHVVLSNFKPGTLASLGLGEDVLRDVNPAIVLVDSSALGRTGPASRRMGYGPLVRARAGLTSLWRYPDDPDGFCDGITVYPDHTAARIGAAGAMAGLIAGRSSGRGHTISVAQAEVMLAQFATEFLRESLQPGSLRAAGNQGEFDAPYGVYPCAGEDEWCVITARGDDDWRACREVIGAGDLEFDRAVDRVANRAAIDDRVSAWTAQRTPDEVMVQLQTAGVPAGAMRRVNELRTDVHLQARGFLTTLQQPQLGDLPTEAAPAHFDRIRLVEPRPAPQHGEQTRAIARGLLGLSEDEIDDLIGSGVLEEWSAPDDHRATVVARIP